MAISFTPSQQKVLDARGHNILVSAAAGSGKTAVLVERIVRLVSEGEAPADIDRLLVVTFTRAAAAQMRERIGQALSAKLAERPDDEHLQRQQVLLHNAQITTMDSFFTFLLRNYFSDIDLDPGFRQIDQTESRLIEKEVMDSFLEEKYASRDEAFLRCVEYFCHGTEDREIEELIRDLCVRAGSHPSPQAWLKERADDYDVRDEEALFSTPWMQSAVLRLSSLLQESDAQYGAMEKLCLDPGGPAPVLPFLSQEREELFCGLRQFFKNSSFGDPGINEPSTLPAQQDFREKIYEKAHSNNDPSTDLSSQDGRDKLRNTLEPRVFNEEGGKREEDAFPFKVLWEEIRRALSHEFPRYPVLRGKKNADLDPALKDAVKSMRDSQKKLIAGLRDTFGENSPEVILAMMEAAREPMKALSALALEFYQRFLEAKQERHVIDFVDLEHYALDILAERRPDGSYAPRRAAKALRGHYAEILIDEYQDSNEVQELMLQIISGEDDGRNNRFMVGDIKQSIYRFRLARPEIFMEKYDAYLPDDPERERIELDKNFRSRKEVLDFVNALFARIMRRETGGVEYNENVSLKQGASFPDPASNPRCGDESGEAADGADSSRQGSPYTAELLLFDAGGAASGGDGSFSDGGPDAEEPFARKEPSEGWEDTFGGAQEEEEEPSDLAEEVEALTDRQKEALLIAGRIRQIVGSLPVRDEGSGKLRPARYGDIVILLRSTVGWNEDLRAVFEREGIPAYAESRTGYFAAREIRELTGLLRVLDNPRQDIPLYGALSGFFGGFSQEELVRIRLSLPDGQLYDALVKTAEGTLGNGEQSMEGAPSESGAPSGDEVPFDYAIKRVGDRDLPGETASADEEKQLAGDGELARRCGEFLSFLDQWRTRAQYLSVPEILSGILEQTGFDDYCAALPAGGQRAANLSFLQSQAEAFAKTDYTGLFQFLRYIEGLKRQEIDYGEANILDENADVVRIMSIHKSKGLEFPVCFVAGLSKGFSFRKFDASGPVLFDGDWGAGINYYDPASRIRATTLRREEIAEKIRRDCMGEELRVLYVAMTRAKEKLIMTASMKDVGKKLMSWRSKMAGFFAAPGDGRLYPSMISGASSFAELICEAIMAQAGADFLLEEVSKGEPGFPQKENRQEEPGFPQGENRQDGSGFPQKKGGQEKPGFPQGESRQDRSGFPQGESGEEGLGFPQGADEASGTGSFPAEIRLLSADDLVMHKAREQLLLSQVDEVWREMEGRPLGGQPDPAAAAQIADKVFFTYPHEELRDLYAHTSVSELKHRAMQSAAGAQDMSPGSDGLSSSVEAGAAVREGSAELFPEMTPVPYLPSFVRSDDSDSGAGGARRGTVFHRILELLDYSRREEYLMDYPEDPSGKAMYGAFGKTALTGWLLTLAEKGVLSPEDRKLISVGNLVGFLRSPLAARMQRAAKDGKLFRERSFLMGCPADEMEDFVPSGGKDPAAAYFPHDEMITLQGIIDAFFIEDGSIILVDYKTDRVKSPGELVLRYRTQLEIYAKALRQGLSMPVSQKIIYSTSLRREIVV